MQKIIKYLTLFVLIVSCFLLPSCNESTATQSKEAAPLEFDLRPLVGVALDKVTVYGLPLAAVPMIDSTGTSGSSIELITDALTPIVRQAAQTIIDKQVEANKWSPDVGKASYALLGFIISAVAALLARRAKR